jgi:hypothetical protein
MDSVPSLRHRLRVRGWCNTLHGPGQLVIKEFYFLGFCHVSLCFCEKIVPLDATANKRQLIDERLFP